MHDMWLAALSRALALRRQQVHACGPRLHNTVRSPVFVVRYGLQDGVDAIGFAQPRLVLLAVLHQDGQQLAGVLLVAVHLAAALLNLAKDPPQQLCKVDQ